MTGYTFFIEDGFNLGIKIDFFIARNKIPAKNTRASKQMTSNILLLMANRRLVFFVQY